MHICPVTIKDPPMKQLIYIFGVTLLFASKAFGQDYCVPVNYRSGQACIQGYGRIHKVLLTGTAGSLIADTPACGPDYRNRTQHMLQVRAGGTVSGTLSIFYTSTHTNVWIDLNDDGVFAANERLFVTGFPNYTSCSGYLETAPWYDQVYAINFTLPADANPGVHRMRIRTAYLNTAETGILLDPCASTNGRLTHYYGTTLDYMVRVSGISPTPFASSPAVSSLTITQPSTR